MTRGLKSGFQWLLDFLIERWPAILIGASSIAMTWFARASAFLQPYGPVAWGGVGIACAVLLSFAYRLWSVAYRSWVTTRFEVRRAETTAVNPLAGQFSKQRLRLADFFHPFFQPTSGAKFEDCELLGPAAVWIVAAQLLNSGFYDCEVVIVKEGANVRGVTAFVNCIFDRCKFFSVTFFLTKDQYLGMKQQMVGGMPPVISDGTAGNL